MTFFLVDILTLLIASAVKTRRNASVQMSIMVTATQREYCNVVKFSASWNARPSSHWSVDLSYQTAALGGTNLVPWARSTTNSQKEERK
jgi:hypothetical protein